MPPRKRRSYTTGYKVEAAHRVIDSGRTIREVADEPGIDAGMLSTWVKAERRRRTEQRLLERNAGLREHVVEKLGLEWSPEQIARRLPLDHPDDSQMRISHETIYRSVCTSRWKLIPKHPAETALQTRRSIRKNKHHSVKGAAAIADHRRAPHRGKTR